MGKDNYIYRESSVKDLEDIQFLILTCFGERTMQGVYSSLEGRYELCVETDTYGRELQIVGMCGIRPREGSFKGYELEWVCVHPDYRKQGIATNLVAHALSGIPVHSSVYCYALHREGEEKAVLDSILSRFWFKLLASPVQVFISGHNCNYRKGLCVNCTGKGCSCSQDLYVRQQ